MPSVTEQLREQLFNTIDDLKNGKVTVENAHVISKLSDNIIKTVIVEIQAAELLGADKIQSLNGHTKDERRQIQGGITHRLKG